MLLLSIMHDDNHLDLGKASSELETGGSIYMDGDIYK